MHDGLSIGGQPDRVLCVRSTWREDRQRVRIDGPHHLVHVREERNFEALTEGLRQLGARVTNRRKSGPVDLPVAEQIGMSLRDPAAAYESKAKHSLTLRVVVGDNIAGMIPVSNTIAKACR